MFNNGTETKVSELQLNMNLAARSIIKVFKKTCSDIVLYCDILLKSLQFRIKVVILIKKNKLKGQVEITFY